MGKFYVTTPIFYVNDKPHIGTAYAVIVADILARWHKIKGEDVFFLTGTDEHGEKIEKSAEKMGKSPKEFVDEIAEKFKSTWKELNIEYDKFIRTTDKDHEYAVAFITDLINKKGDIYKGEYEGWYCVPDETFLTDLELKDGRCPACGREVKKMKEENYFFKLSKYQEKLLSLYSNNSSFVIPDFRLREVENRIKEGLHDLDITRKSVKWGIPFELDKSFTIYVWLDALTNYLSGIGWPNNKDFNELWSNSVHVVGKEINWFHSVIWPAFLMSAGIDPPKQVLVHGWWTIDGKKISKSFGNAIDPVDLVKRYSSDALRYALIKEKRIWDDGDFSEESLKARINGELAADLGNLVYRTLTLVEKFEGELEGTPELDSKLKLNKIVEAMDNFDTYLALSIIWDFIKETNKYVTDREPWKLKEKELGNVLYNLLEAIRIIATLLYPFIPHTSNRIFSQLGISASKLEDCKFTEIHSRPRKGEPLFKKV